MKDSQFSKGKGRMGEASSSSQNATETTADHIKMEAKKSDKIQSDKIQIEQYTAKITQYSNHLELKSEEQKKIKDIIDRGNLKGLKKLSDKMEE